MQRNSEGSIVGVKLLVVDDINGPYIRLWWYRYVVVQIEGPMNFTKPFPKLFVLESQILLNLAAQAVMFSVVFSKIESPQSVMCTLQYANLNIITLYRVHFHTKLVFSDQITLRDSHVARTERKISHYVNVMYLGLYGITYLGTWGLDCYYLTYTYLGFNGIKSNTCM